MGYNTKLQRTVHPLRKEFFMKRFLFCVLLAAGTALFAQEAGQADQPEQADNPGQAASPEQTAKPEKVYRIGDTGPAGGIIFYDKGFYGDGWRYLEAAPVGSELKAEWGSYRSRIPGTMPGIGFGKQNTAFIIERLNALGELNRAAQICASLEINGYKDWFLPSKDELNLMYKNLKSKKIGDFGNSWYWSSTEQSSDDGWSQGFVMGIPNDTAKDRKGTVRAARFF
jgi:hypothetical protein